MVQRRIELELDGVLWLQFPFVAMPESEDRSGLIVLQAGGRRLRGAVEDSAMVGKREVETARTPNVRAASCEQTVIL